jgi:peptide/nickel transport system substrate-binding protein
MATCGTKALAIGAAASIALAGCAGNLERPSDGGSAKTARHGTLTYYIEGPADDVDPQLVYAGREISNLARTVYRSLVTFPVSKDVAESTTTVADLATDTGTSEDGAKTWTFTLKDGVTWQDGQPITCADFKYGASRAFATDVITDGPKYLLFYLDIPTDPGTGLPVYTGPYRSSAEGKAAFDKAITCDGKTITYHFKKPWADFPLAIASLHMMDPYRQDKDLGAKSSYQIFSNGPYKLDGTWDKNKGGTLIRNPEYDASTDSTDVRKALPDKIVFDLSKTAEQINRRLIDDRGQDRAAVTAARIPPAYYSEITGAVARRTVTVPSPYVRYLVPNFRRLTKLQVRQALAASTDVTAWVEAGGGDKAYEEAHDIVNPAVNGYQDDLFPAGHGDPEKSKQLLEQAGVQTPYPITFTYPSNPTTDKQVAAIKEGWEKAGFEVTPDGHKDYEEYFNYIRKPDQDADVILTDWGADWPSAITVTAPQFDSRPNLTDSSNGADIGAYKSAEFEALVDAAQAASDLDAQTTILQQADQMLADDVAYIPLDTLVFYFLHGSEVTGYVNTAASNWYPDLGAIGVK